MIKIISIFDKHQDFIELQYESIKKHVKSEYEYIVFNNASTKDQEILNEKTCEKLNIKCIRINVKYNNDPSNIAGNALNEAFKYLKNDLVFKIDSDMFFMSDINLYDFFENYDLSYVPNYRSDYKPNLMWSGVFGINMKKIEIDLDFRPKVVIPNSDTFGQSILLTSNNKYSKKLFELHNLFDLVDGILMTNLNTDCRMEFQNNSLLSIEKKDYPIQKDKDYSLKYNNILKIMELYEFPKPYNIDIIEVGKKDFIFHFKSSNWCPWYTDDYVNLKKKSLINLLNNL